LLVAHKEIWEAIESGRPLTAEEKSAVQKALAVDSALPDRTMLIQKVERAGNWIQVLMGSTFGP
jgi:hypothetical protein